MTYEIIFFCYTCSRATTAKQGPVACEGCNKTMIQAGWFEYDENARKNDAQI